MTFGQRVQICRVGLGLLVLFLFHLLSNIPLPGLVRGLHDQEALGTVDEVTAYEKRLAWVKLELPARGTVGYRTQLQKKGDEDVFVYRTDGVLVEMPVMNSYWLTQYAVAPVIVDPRGKHPLTIVNLRDEVRLVRSEGR
jgi:hypothetical protein